MYLYMPDFQLILYGPESLPSPLLKSSLQAMGIAPEGVKGEKELAPARK